MRRRKVTIGVLAVVLCAVLVEVFWPEKPEPVYKGRTLSEWVEFRVAKKEVIETSTAIEAVGTNGIPFYVEWIRYEPGFFKVAQTKLAEKARDWLHVKWTPQDPSPDRAYGAYLALRALGERAAPAIPQLLVCATNISTKIRPPAKQGRGDQSFYGISGLVNIGRPALPAVLSLTTNANPRVRTSAIFVTRAFYGSRSVLAQLRRSLQDPDPGVRAAAKFAIEPYEYDIDGPMDKP
jgi:hypothetical protein